MYQKFNNLLNEMKELLLIADIPKYQINIRYNQPKTKTVLDAFDWLHDLFLSGEFKQLKYVWGLLPKKTWDQYEKLGIKELTEQKMLEDAKKAVLKKWKSKRPRLIGRKNVIHT